MPTDKLAITYGNMIYEVPLTARAAYAMGDGKFSSRILLSTYEEISKDTPEAGILMKITNTQENVSGVLIYMVYGNHFARMEGIELVDALPFKDRKGFSEKFIHAMSSEIEGLDIILASLSVATKKPIDDMYNDYESEASRHVRSILADPEEMHISTGTMTSVTLSDDRLLPGLRKDSGFNPFHINIQKAHEGFIKAGQEMGVTDNLESAKDILSGIYEAAEKGVDAVTEKKIWHISSFSIG